jgi:coenzyme PQQ biosynthesis protein PqqD
MIDPEAVLALRKDVRFRRVADEGVVLVQEDGRVLGVNDSGARVLELMDGRRTLREIVDELGREVDADRGAIEADVASFVLRLREARALVETAPGASGAP